MSPKPNQKKYSLAALLLLMAITGCKDNTVSTYVAQDTPPPTQTEVQPTPTPFPPSPISVPTAAIVNEDQITLEEFQEELSRYKAAVNRELTEEDQELVIHNLINLTLLAQSANAEGFQISDTELDSRMADLDTEEQPLADWLAANGFTEEAFRQHLKRSLEAAWMRDRVIAEVPETAEQIQAQQMLFYDLNSAYVALEYLQEGRDFAQLATTFDPQAKGYLGWFPQGYLTIPELDPILFSMEVGETSDIIETDIGFHIIKVLDKETDRPLDPTIRQQFQEKALDEWLEQQWKLSTIEITVP